MLIKTKADAVWEALQHKVCRELVISLHELSLKFDFQKVSFL